MVDTNTLRALRATIHEFINKDVETDLMKMGFHAQQYNLEQLKKFLHYLEQLPLENAPNEYLLELNSRLQSFIKAINSLVAAHGSDLPDDISNKFELFKQQYDVIFKDVLIIFQIITIQQGVIGDDTKRKEEAFSAYIELSKLELKARKEQLEKQVESFDEIINNIKDKHKGVEVNQYAGLFAKESKEHTTNANIWLTISLVTFIFIVCWLIHLMEGGIDSDFIEKLKAAKIDGDDSRSLVIFHVIQQMISKILIASLLFYGLAFSVKAFRANRHNSIVNKHRQNALGSFEAFVNSPSTDVATKNAVLLEATHTIFSHQSTGYDTNDKDSEVPNKIIEIIKPVG